MKTETGSTKKAVRRAPCRIDLAGGTLDLWPLYLYFGGLELVNMAIEVRATTEIEWKPGSAGFELTVESADMGTNATYRSIGELASSLRVTPRENPLRWVNRVAHHWLSTRPSEGAWTVRTRSDAPPGSGLGGSSVLGVSMQLAFHDIFGGGALDDRARWTLQQNTRDLEAVEIEHPAGDQDYVPALFGGLLVMHLNDRERRVEPLPREMAEWVSDRVALLYTGKPHHSGLNNWQIFKALHDGDASVRAALGAIGEISKRVAASLRAGEPQALSDLLNAEWEQRQRLSPSICPPVLDEAWAHARSLGATGRKACGSGGGGCMLFAFPDAAAKKAAVERQLPSTAWKWLPTTAAT